MSEDWGSDIFDDRGEGSGVFAVFLPWGRRIRRLYDARTSADAATFHGYSSRACGQAVVSRDNLVAYLEISLPVRVDIMTGTTVVNTDFRGLGIRFLRR